MELDHCGPFPKTTNNNNYVLTIIDHFTRKRWYIPTKTTNAEETFQALLTVCTSFDFPSIILTDQGAAFTSKLAEEITKMTNITPTFSQTGQHDTTGSVERSNLIMEDIIRKYIDKTKQDDWDVYLGLAAYAINKSISASHGLVPDELIFGKIQKNLLEDERLFNDKQEYSENNSKKLKKAIQTASTTLKEYQEKMKKQIQQKMGIRKPTDMKKDDIVYMKKDEENTIKGLSHKLDDQSMGPFKINEIDKEKGNVKIQVAPSTEIIVKKSNLRLAKDQKQDLNDLVKTHKEVIIKSTKPGIEIIELAEISKFPKKENKNYYGKKINIKDYTVKNLVGKRINIYWKNGPLKGWYKGTVIGYNNKMTMNMIYYDDRTLDVDESVDYYSHNLFNKTNTWKLLA
jgi:hypothetical protein